MQRSRLIARQRPRPDHERRRRRLVKAAAMEPLFAPGASAGAQRGRMKAGRAERGPSPKREGWSGSPQGPDSHAADFGGRESQAPGSRLALGGLGSNRIRSPVVGERHERSILAAFVRGKLGNFLHRLGLWPIRPETFLRDGNVVGPFAGFGWGSGLNDSASDLGVGEGDIIPRKRVVASAGAAVAARRL